MYSVSQIHLPVAGLPPPPSLFPKSSQAAAMTPPAVPGPVATTAESSSGSSSSGEEGDGDTQQLWVQCEHVYCRKWRPLREEVEIDTKRWPVGQI